MLTLALTSHPTKIPEICSFVVFHKFPEAELAKKILKMYPEREYYHECPNCIYKILLKKRERENAAKDRVTIPLGVPVLDAEPAYSGGAWSGYSSNRVVLERKRVS